MPQVFFVIPGDLSLPTGGYAYDRHVLEGSEAHGLDLRHLALPGSYPAPTRDDLAETARLLAQTPDDAILLIDGLAYGAMPADLIASFKRRIVALTHHPLGLESGLAEARGRELVASEKAALALARRIIVTSAVTARTLMKDFAVPQQKLVVAEPGVEPAARAAGSGAGEPLNLLAVGSVVARKGYDILVAALARLASLDWSLAIAGATDRAAETHRALVAQIAARGLAPRIRIAGALDGAELDGLYARADLFVMSSLYEGYGMVVTEALARGLPIVSTSGGALAETVPDDAGIKVPPGDIHALADALRTMMLDAALRRRCADAAWARAASLPRWNETVARIAATVQDVAREDAPEETG